jgi:hypothetical protein
MASQLTLAPGMTIERYATLPEEMKGWTQRRRYFEADRLGLW